MQFVSLPVHIRVILRDQTVLQPALDEERLVVLFHHLLRLVVAPEEDCVRLLLPEREVVQTDVLPEPKDLLPDSEIRPQVAEQSVIGKEAVRVLNQVRMVGVIDTVFPHLADRQAEGVEQYLHRRIGAQNRAADTVQNQRARAQLHNHARGGRVRQIPPDEDVEGLVQPELKLVDREPGRHDLQIAEHHILRRIGHLLLFQAG